jgi:hypothetical protein
VTAGLARAILAVATASLGDHRREWACAMRGEFDAAVEDRRALGFATGCLVAAWREMPGQAEGRFALANYAFALCLMLPVALLQFEYVAGLPFLAPGQAGPLGMLAQHSMQDPYSAGAYLAAIPSLLVLWVLLGIGHLRLAWALLDRNWPQAIKRAAFNVAVSATLVIFTVVLFLDDAGAGWQAIVSAVELGAIHAFSIWHGRLFADAPSARLA